jgi:hypothetical protein
VRVPVLFLKAAKSCPIYSQLWVYDVARLLPFYQLSQKGKTKMDRRILLLLLGVLVSLGVVSTFVARSDSASTEKPKMSAKFEEYRAALKKAYQVDIVNSKTGSKAVMPTARPSRTTN